MFKYFSWSLELSLITFTACEYAKKNLKERYLQRNKHEDQLTALTAFGVENK